MSVMVPGKESEPRRLRGRGARAIARSAQPLLASLARKVPTPDALTWHGVREFVTAQRPPAAVTRIHAFVVKAAQRLKPLADSYPADASAIALHQHIRRHIAVAAVVMLTLVIGIGGWTISTKLSGAVIAPGVLVVDSNVKKIQHPAGGIVSELAVREGDRVRAGDILVKLDRTQTQANLAIVLNTLDELAARHARLEAERDDASIMSFPNHIVSRESVTSERKLFEMRRKARLGQKAQMKERVAQLGKEIQGLTAQIAAKEREIELISQELQGVRDLWQKRLIQVQRLTSLERDAARLEGERGQLISLIAQAEGKITEIGLQIVQVDQDLGAEVSKEIREVQTKTGEFLERKVAALDELRRMDIRAPQAGLVHQISVHTVGGVIRPGEPIMLIVPGSDGLTVEAKIRPEQIDHLHVGQTATLRFSALNQATTPEIRGEVGVISADVTRDDKNGSNFYTVKIAFSQGEISQFASGKLLPGMPVETFIQTGERTVFSYLAKPISDQIARAWKEK